MKKTTKSLVITASLLLFAVLIGLILIRPWKSSEHVETASESSALDAVSNDSEKEQSSASDVSKTEQDGSSSTGQSVSSDVNTPLIPIGIETEQSHASGSDPVGNDVHNVEPGQNGSDTADEDQGVDLIPVPIG